MSKTPDPTQPTEKTETTKGPATVVERPGHRTLKVFGVTVQGTANEKHWPALDRLAEAINIAAEQHGVQSHADSKTTEAAKESE